MKEFLVQRGTNTKRNEIHYVGNREKTFRVEIGGNKTRTSKYYQKTQVRIDIRGGKRKTSTGKVSDSRRLSRDILVEEEIDRGGNSDLNKG